MNKPTKLSIITINYNNAKGLQTTINSVLHQSYKDYQYVIIDGGSTDESVQVIKKNEKFIDFFLSEKDHGIYNAMNKGILNSYGDYCFFLNSGDYFSDNSVLERVLSFDPSEDIVFGNIIVCLHDKIIGKSLGKKDITYLDLYNSIIKHQASFIKRELLITCGLYNENYQILSDWEFFLRTIGSCRASYKYIDVDIAFFDNDGISNNSQEIVSNERLSILNEYLPKIMQPDYIDLSQLNRYKILTEYRVTDILIRILRKITTLLIKGHSLK